MAVRLANICIDCADPATLARFWSQALGWEITSEDADEFEIHATDNSQGPDILFLKVPEPKTLKNRLHLDFRPDDRDAEVARLERLGAYRVDIGQGPDVTWVVMADPEGNEFCVLRTLGPDEQ
jgi:predicted enzyme related to lactoylglutathione lyase